MKSDACSSPRDCRNAAVAGAIGDCKRERQMTRYRLVSYIENGVQYRCEIPTDRVPEAESTTLPEPIGTCSSKDVAERQTAGMSPSAIERACSP